jgi:hypothetical protein
MEPQTSGDIAWLLTTVEYQEGALMEVMDRLEVIEKELSNAVKRRDSVEIGTAGKGGQLKVYFDSMGDPKANDAAVAEAKRVLLMAGGTAATGGV